MVMLAFCPHLSCRDNRVQTGPDAKDKTRQSGQESARIDFLGIGSLAHPIQDHHRSDLRASLILYIPK